jgi:predicted naringenin-chalcone synthase
MHQVSIAGLGIAIPNKPVTTDKYIAHAKQFAAASPKQERIIEELYRRTSIRQRSSVIAGSSYGPYAEEVYVQATCEDDRGPTTGHRMRYYAAEVGSMARRACEAAFEDASVNKEDVTHLVTVSCTGFNAPGFDIELIQSLPLRPTTKRTHVGFMGCHGGINGLRVAHAYLEADPQAKVLLCMAEACSLHFQYGWGSDRLIANSLFADGAAAALLTAGAGGVKGSGHVMDTASFIIPNTLDAMTWRIGDNGFEMHLDTAVPDLIRAHLPSFLHEWLSWHAIDAQHLSWAVHPGGPKILDAVEDCMNLPPEALEASRETLELCGNMSSPTVFFILQKLRAQRKTGPCLTVEAALLQLS